MNLENRKYNLINWIINLQSEDLINYLEFLKKDHQECWDDLPKALQTEITEAQENAKEHRFTSHEEQLKKYKSFLS
jgi:hypothetical protein